MDKHMYPVDGEVIVRGHPTAPDGSYSYSGWAYETSSVFYVARRYDGALGWPDTLSSRCCFVDALPNDRGGRAVMQAMSEMGDIVKEGAS